MTPFSDLNYLIPAFSARSRKVVLNAIALFRPPHYYGFMNVSETQIPALLKKYDKFTVYGLSPNPEKPSHTVPLSLLGLGMRPVGIYPEREEIAGIPIYQSLKDVPDDFRKFIDIFRRPEHLPHIVDEILAVGGVEVLWLQLGVAHPEAEKRAEDAGLKVVSNRCLYIEYKKYLGVQES